MKISYRTHPILEKLETGKLSKLFLSHADKDELERRLSENVTVSDLLRLLWNKNAPLFRRQIRLITNPFLEAFELAKGKLKTSELYEEVLSGFHSGTFISGDKVVCYFIDDIEVQNVRNHAATFFIFHEVNKGELLLLLAGSFTPENKNYQPLYVASLLKESWNVNEWIEDVFDNTVLLINFIKYAPIETKYLPANKRIKDFNCKYLNETSSNIQILDCTWLTNIVRAEGFGVRGHFRMQACGQAFKDRKMIWIKDFEKHGYTRQAGRLKEETTNL